MADSKGAGRAVAFSWLSDAWRQKSSPETPTVARGVLGPYLNPLAFAEDEEDSESSAELGKAIRPQVKPEGGFGDEGQRGRGAGTVAIGMKAGVGFRGPTGTL